MTRKQMKKFAQEIYKYEQIQQNTTSYTEKLKAENKIMNLTNDILGEPDGITTMLEIDTMIQELVNKNNMNGEN